MAGGSLLLVHFRGTWEPREPPFSCQDLKDCDVCPASVFEASLPSSSLVVAHSLDLADHLPPSKRRGSTKEQSLSCFSFFLQGPLLQPNKLTQNLLLAMFPGGGHCPFGELAPAWRVNH